MPFTPFHVGPALGFGLPSRRYLHVPTFILANVIVDVEPLVVLVFWLRYPLHGYFHTFLIAFFAGFALGYVMFLFERVLHPLYEVFLLESGAPRNLRSFFIAGVAGTSLHVLLDSLLISEMHPFFPFMRNPMYNSALSSEVYGFCVGMGIIGVAYYVGCLAFSAHKRFSA